MLKEKNFATRRIFQDVPYTKKQIYQKSSIFGHFVIWVTFQNEPEWLLCFVSDSLKITLNGVDVIENQIWKNKQKLPLGEKYIN